MNSKACTQRDWTKRLSLQPPPLRGGGLCGGTSHSDPVTTLPTGTTARLQSDTPTPEPSLARRRQARKALVNQNVAERLGSKYMRPRRGSSPQQHVAETEAEEATQARSQAREVPFPVGRSPSSALAQCSSGGDNRSVPAIATIEIGASSTAPPRRRNAGQMRHRRQLCSTIITNETARQGRTTSEQSLSQNGSYREA